MYTLQQLINFTPEQLRSDPKLLDTINRLYGGTDIRQHLLNDPSFQETVRKQLEKVALPGYAISMDAVQNAQRDVQNGRPINQKSAQEIEEAKKLYAQLGVDVNSVPIFQQIQGGNVPETYGGKVASNPPTQTNAVVTGQDGSGEVNTTQPGKLVPQNQISSQLGQNFTRIGSGVFYVEKDGSLGKHLTGDDFIKNWKDKGLNLVNIPQYTGVSGVTGYSVDDLDAKIKNWDIDPSGLSAEQKAVLGSMIAGQESAASLGRDVSINNAFDFKKYYDEALTRLDPEFQALSGLGRREFDLAVSNLTQDFDYQQRQIQNELVEARRAQDEKYSELGQASSGYRNRAIKQLQEQGESVISSSKRALEKDVFGLGSGFEKQYGSSALPNLNIAGTQYSAQGGIQGQLPEAQHDKAIQEAYQKAGLLPYAQAQAAKTQQIINPIT